jgi:hypothetical protein
MPPLSTHRRRILTLRHRDRTWAEAEDRLFDRGGPGLFYALCLAKEGVGTRAEAFADFEASCLELLALMEEARPTCFPELRTRWESWFQDWPRR